MSIKSLVTRMRTDAAADAVVDHIYTHNFAPGASESQYLEKYFDLDVRRRVFDGGTTSGRYLLLSPAAQRLKAAFQRRFVQSGCVEFPPTVGYHRTSTAEIAGMIARTGFKLANGYVGKGVCFFTHSDRADDYLAPTIVPPEGGAALAQVILEVTVYSRRAIDGVMPTGSDQVAHYHRQSTIMTVKNPLVIFPKAVYLPGEKFANVINPDPAWKG